MAVTSTGSVRYISPVWKKNTCALASCGAHGSENKRKKKGNNEILIDIHFLTNAFKKNR